MRAPSLAVVVGLIAGLLCHSALGAESRAARAKRAANPTAPVRLVPPLDGAEVATLGVESDGTRRLVAYGLRLLTRPDGSVETAAEFFPLARNVSAIELPERLGRGFLFSLIASGRTAVWRAPSWTGPLEPFAELDFEIERLVPGFDRVYAQARRTGEWAALDSNTGKALDLGSLPRSPNYGAMVFVDEWFGAVELPIRGTVVSFDAGNRWHRLELTTLGLGRTGNELLVVTPEGRRALAADGAVRPLDSGGDNRADPNEPRRVNPEGPLGVLPLRTALLRGFPDGTENAIVAAQGAVARVRLSDGRVLALRDKVLSPSSSCVGVRLGKGYGFACGEPAGKTSVFAFEAPLGLRPVEEFESGRAISESGNGGLVIRGRCGPKAADAVPGVHCIRTPAGERWELVPILNDRGVERVVALSDGRAALLVPPRAAVHGSLVLASANGKAQPLPLKLTSRDTATDVLLKKGFWLDGFVEARDGSLRGWVTGQGVFAGVRVERDGSVHPGPLQRSIERAVISGERALIVPATGIAEQSTDGGQTFTDADLPVEIEADPAKAAPPSANLEQGCSRLGCSFLGWLRVGWNGPAGSQPLAVATQPKPTVLPSPGGGRWLLRCSPTGEVSPRIAVPAVNRPRKALEREDGQSSWLPLFEEPPPPIPKDALAFDTGNEGQLRGYAWAPRGAEFGKTGKLAVTVADRFRIRDGIWTTRPSPSPWADVGLVSEVFGYEGSSPAVWNLTLDAGGRSGVLAISARGTTDLFAVEENRMATLLVSASRHGIGTVLSTARLGTTYYVAAQEDGRNFRVFALESGRARLVGQYADVALGRTIAPTLVRSTRGDALAIWGRGVGWFVLPIDSQTGAVDRAIEISPRALASMPEPCAPDEEGYLLEGPVGIDPYADFVDGADEVSARGFEGRFVVSARGICLSELTARSEGVVESALKPAKSPPRTPTASVPLVLADRASGGRRWGFRCSR